LRTTPARPPSEETVEASASAVYEDMERMRDLPGDSDDDDDLEELFGRGAGGGDDAYD